jgi:dTDP-4-dehydrorhamnose reductase
VSVRILLIGAGGQLGRELIPRLSSLGELAAADRTVCDLAATEAIRELVARTRPEAIVNAAAYTAVDEAESRSEVAYAINRDAPRTLAEEARKLGAMLVHYSTDYVFDGSKPGAYCEEDATAPLNVYGASKLAGEREIAAVGGRYLILRTSWVYGAQGKNFLLTMRRLAREREELRVVDDQVGAPTSTLQLAEATARLVREWSTAGEGFPAGIYHATAAGSVSWCGFARAIVAALGERDSLKVKNVVGITTEEYPMPARRPRNSVLSNEKFERTFGFRPGSWETGLADVVRELYGCAVAES